MVTKIDVPEVRNRDDLCVFVCREYACELLLPRHLLRVTIYSCHGHNKVSVLKPADEEDPDAWIDAVLQQAGTTGLTPERRGGRAEVRVRVRAVWDSGCHVLILDAVAVMFYFSNQQSFSCVTWHPHKFITHRQ